MMLYNKQISDFIIAEYYNNYVIMIIIFSFFCSHSLEF